MVFLFLGSLRATLIPTLAVPVSLIGAFIVLNAVGYSANTVSLLAIVLAIGIVVDDAIVVVENVERVMEENPEMTPAEATKKAMAEITAPIIAITLVLLSVFVPIAFIPGISGELFRQFAVTVAVAMLLSAINALTLSPALCGMLLKRHHGPRRGVIGWIMRAIDRVRDRYGAVVARLVRISVVGLALVAAAGVGVWLLAANTPTGFLPRGRPGRLLRRRAIARRRLGRPHQRGDRQVETMLRQEAAIADYTCVVGLNFIDNYSQPNAAFVVVTLKPFEERKGAHDQRRTPSSRGSAQKFAQIRGGTVAPLAPPPIIGLGTGGGFTYVLQDSKGGDPKELAQVLRGLTVAANQDPQLQPGVQHLFRHQSVDLSRYRPRQGADARRARSARVPVAASLARRLFRQQHEPVRPHLAGAGAGRGQDRASVDDIYRINVRCQRGQDDPAAQPRGSARWWSARRR